MENVTSRWHPGDAGLTAKFEFPGWKVKQVTQVQVLTKIYYDQAAKRKDSSSGDGQETNQNSLEAKKGDLIITTKVMGGVCEITKISSLHNTHSVARAHLKNKTVY